MGVADWKLFHLGVLWLSLPMARISSPKRLTKGTQVADATKASSKAEARRAPRGTGFPKQSLPEAIKIIETAGKYGRTHATAGLAAHMGLTTDNSGAFSAKVAALKDWGLITGTREAGFSLTDGAWVIAHPSSTKAKQIELAAAFRRAKVFWATYETLAKGVDLEVKAIGNRAVTNLGVAAASKTAFARSFVESAVAVGLAERVDSNVVRLKLGSDERTLGVPEQSTTPADQVEASVEEESTASFPPRVDPSGARAVLDQEWLTATGKVTLQIFQENALPAKVFMQVGKVAEEIERLAAMLGGNGMANG